MDTKALTSFKELRAKLVDEFNTKKAEVLALETELINLGVIQPTKPPVVTQSTPATLPEDVSPKRKKILEFCATPRRLTEISEHTGGQEFTTVSNMVKDKQLKIVKADGKKKYQTA